MDNINNGINLSSLNDNQKLWLSQISYLNFTEEGRKRMLNGGLTVAELKPYLENPNEPFCGNANFNNDTFFSLSNGVLGEGKIPTRGEMLDTIINSGLGDLKITNISTAEQAKETGFQALTFEDSYQNTGISYRGSDLDFKKGGLKDWIVADYLEYYKNDSPQRSEALEYFEANKNANGNNYVYGHSLGGNLTSYVYLDNYDEIQEAFTFNGNPINQHLIDTPEKKVAFNDPKKYNCNVVCGDVVGHFKDYTTYENNVKYIKNNEIMKANCISAHLAQAVTLDQNGNFVPATEKEMVDKLSYGKYIFDFVKFKREALNYLWDMQKNSTESVRNYGEELGKSINKFFKKYNINLDLNSNEREVSQPTEEDLVNAFKKASNEAEIETINKLKQQNLEQELLNQNNQMEQLQQEESYSRSM